MSPWGTPSAGSRVAANDRHDLHRLGWHRLGVHSHYPQRFRGRFRADEVVEADQRMGLAPAEGRVEPEERRCRGVPARQPPDDLANKRLGSIGRIRVGEEEVGVLVHLVGPGRVRLQTGWPRTSRRAAPRTAPRLSEYRSHAATSGSMSSSFLGHHSNHFATCLDGGTALTGSNLTIPPSGFPGLP